MRRLMIDKQILEANVRAVQRAADTAAVYGVLKADGYGLGLAPLAATLAGQGIDRFAVTEPAAALALARTGLPAREILLLTPITAGADVEALLRLGTVTFSVGTPEEAVRLARAGLRLGVRPRAHIQIDTGLGRYGFRWDEPERLRFLYESFTAVRFTGIYTHFASPGNAGATRRQFGRFRSVLRALSAAGIDPGTRHCCASSALLRYPAMRLDAVRVGSAFLGRVPDAGRWGLINACWCEATVETVRDLPAGTALGYGASFRARRDMRVAAVDVGAIHGLGARPGCGRRSFLSGSASLLRGLWRTLRGGSGLTAEVRGATAPVLGRLCAECALLDVTDLDCAPGDTARFSANPLYLKGVERVWVDAEARADVRPVA